MIEPTWARTTNEYEIPIRIETERGEAIVFLGLDASPTGERYWCTQAKMPYRFLNGSYKTKEEAVLEAERHLGLQPYPWEEDDDEDDDSEEFIDEEGISFFNL